MLFPILLSFWCWPLHERQVLYRWATPWTPLPWLLFSLNNCLIVLSCFPGFLLVLSGQARGRKWVCLRSKPVLCCIHAHRVLFSLFWESAGITQELYPGKAPAWKSRKALLPAVCLPCCAWCPSPCWAVLAPVPPGTALVSCTVCEGRNRWKERLKRIWLSQCRPHPTTLALGLGSEVLQLQPPHLLCGTFLPKGVNALCWFPF